MKWVEGRREDFESVGHDRAQSHRAVREGSEEYLDSEKYEVKDRTLESAPLLPLVKALNRIRRENPALQRVDNLTFLETESDHLIAYAKVTGDNAVATVVNLDPFESHEGVAILPASLGLPPSLEMETSGR